MTNTTTTPASTQSAFDRAIADYGHARAALDALPVETTSSEVEQIAMDAVYTAERRLLRQSPQNVSDVRAMAEIVWADPDSIPCEDSIAAVLNGLRKLDGKPSRTFSATAWLVQFERLGGGWTDVEGEVSLLTPVPTNDGLKSLLWQLDTTGGREQVKAAIRSKSDAVSAVVAPTDWDTLCRNYERAKSAVDAHHAIGNPHPFGSAECNLQEATMETLATAQGDAFTALMLFPAPNAAALAYKLATQLTFLGGDQWHESSAIAKQLAADAASLLPKVA
ncbi:hypothetical protein A3736_01865 [Erythrobacter sp. HI0063]|uniref:hypothetical protein n=1 Tax=Erythrobacter sp. HI0063 TaxID=1822240 RepID=UPI0007C29B16|nr:hypothetical protein [Erythrobacter sp. HI0063]KZY55398.1 hypothetical protein A3736_01865 [Erythrobacter sp. HI0063]